MPLIPPSGSAPDKQNIAQKQSECASPRYGYPGCLTVVVPGLILLVVSLIIVGSLWLGGVDLQRRFFLVLGIFAVVGAFMLQLARRLQP